MLVLKLKKIPCCTCRVAVASAAHSNVRKNVFPHQICLLYFHHWCEQYLPVRSLGLKAAQKKAAVTDPTFKQSSQNASPEKHRPPWSNTETHHATRFGICPSTLAS